MVILSKPAREDLRQIFEYIAQDSRYYAREVTLSIIEKIKTLNKFPFRGKVVPELNDDNIREIFLYSYRIVYRILNDNVEVAAIIHAKQDFNQATNDRIF